MKKNKYVPVAIATAIGLTAIPILVTPNVSNNLATKTLTSSNAIDKVDISSVIQITNLNTFHQGKNVAPSIKDINNALKVLNNPLGTQTNWYPNQWIFTSFISDINGNGSCQLSVVDWSPNYNQGTLTLNWIQSDINPTANTIASYFNVTDGYYNLSAGVEQYFPSNDTTITGIDLLKYLGTDTYRAGIDINQLNVTEPIWLDSVDSNNMIDCYYVDLTPKSGTNFYVNQSEQFRVYYDKQRTNLLDVTNPNFVTDVGTFYTLPSSGDQLKSKLKSLNTDAVFDSVFNRGTPVNDTTWDWNNTASTTNPKFTFVGNETFTTKIGSTQQTQSPINLSIDFVDVSLATIFLTIDPTTNVDLNQMSYKPNQQDIQSALMNHGGSDGSAITNFQWDQLQYQFTYNDENKTGTVVVTPIATCIQYSGSVTVSFNWVN